MKSRSPRMRAFADAGDHDWTPKVGEAVWVPFRCTGGIGARCRFGTIMEAAGDCYLVRGWYRDRPMTATYGGKQLRPGATPDYRTITPNGELFGDVR